MDPSRKQKDLSDPGPEPSANPQPSTLNPKPSTLNSRLVTECGVDPNGLVDTIGEERAIHFAAYHGDLATVNHQSPTVNLKLHPAQRPRTIHPWQVKCLLALGACSVTTST